MAAMFYQAIAFNRSVGNWNVANVTSMTNMLDGTAMSTGNYNATLVGWAAQSGQNNVNLGAVGRLYSTTGQAGRG